MADWQTIKTEYITTDISYRKLAEKYGVHRKTISSRSRAEDWVQLRKQYKTMTITKAVEKISEKKARQAAKVCDLADKLLIKLEQAIDELDLKETKHRIKTDDGDTQTTTEYKETQEGGTVDRAGLRQLIGALKELKIIKDEISDLERREREARIEALHRRYLTDDGDGEETGVVLLPPRKEEDPQWLM